MRQDHLQHISLELLHHDEDPLRGLEHPLEVHHAGVRQVLKDGYFVFQLGFLFRRETELVYNLGEGKNGKYVVYIDSIVCVSVCVCAFTFYPQGAVRHTLMATGLLDLLCKPPYTIPNCPEPSTSSG